MKQSYEGVYQNGQINWIDEPPKVTSVRVLVTFLTNNEPKTKRRIASATIAGQAKTLGDLVSPIVSDEEWECLK
ncbi:hypothetical protein [Merismopedia glauca]|uniref:Uncharacterized protein n=1 Tax=Merismopedia glauca CCAP 1448/3 TaxID=1296344 RepID=A0A2T1BWK4_9CYAN|nr:hypothetical protein [Merismopedia glauca]PSB00400.1 hypothetical protein C7B64_23740 [Merismopedia glauca CCAP 1448/3]